MLEVGLVVFGEPLIKSFVLREAGEARRFADPKVAKRGRGRRSSLFVGAKVDNDVLRPVLNE
jgi:hypothetical protein